MPESSDQKKKDIRQRIASNEEALAKARAFLESGANADWHGFRALLSPKIRDGKVEPPHKDWVRNVFIPRCEKAIHKDERRLDQFE